MSERAEAEALLAHHLFVFRRIDLESIDAIIARARGVVVSWQVDQVAAARERALSLLSTGQFDAAMEAGQALFNAANGLHNALELLLPARTGRKTREGAAMGNATKTANAEAQRDDWQRRANEKWGQPEHANKSVREVARLIAKEGENIDTIRRRIKKLA